MEKKYYCGYCNKEHQFNSKIGFLHYEVQSMIKHFIKKEYEELLIELSTFDNDKDNYVKHLIKNKLDSLK
jgi:hypothetical protein